MNIIDHVRHIPAIESAIAELKPDALVVGLGASGWLLPWIDQKLLSGVRLFGSHDGCRVMPMDDLIIMDGNNRALANGTERYNGIVNARPKRIWTYHLAHDQWVANIPQCLHSITSKVFWIPYKGSVSIPDQHLAKIGFQLVPPPFHIRDKGGATTKTIENPLHTALVAPTGMTTLAWQLGCRRIGVIGVDMRKNHFHAWPNARVVDHFFVRIAEQAHALGGVIRNLSPITDLKKFAAWKPSASSSAQTSGSTVPEPNSSSNTASDATRSETCPSPGCEPATKDGPSASTAIPDLGRLVAP